MNRRCRCGDALEQPKFKTCGAASCELKSGNYCEIQNCYYKRVAGYFCNTHCKQFYKSGSFENLWKAYAK